MSITPLPPPEPPTPPPEPPLLPPAAEPPGPLPPTEYRGNIAMGCLMGCGIQLVFGIGSLMLATTAGPGRLFNILFVSWGLTQWIALVPLILQQQRKGHSYTVAGIAIIGFIGVMLCAACGSMLQNFSR